MLSGGPFAIKRLSFTAIRCRLQAFASETAAPQQVNTHYRRQRARQHDRSYKSACPFTVHRTASDNLPVYVIKRKNRPWALLSEMFHQFYCHPICPHLYAFLDVLTKGSMYFHAATNLQQETKTSQWSKRSVEIQKLSGRRSSSCVRRVPATERAASCRSLGITGGSSRVTCKASATEAQKDKKCGDVAFFVWWSWGKGSSGMLKTLIFEICYGFTGGCSCPSEGCGFIAVAAKGSNGPHSITHWPIGILFSQLLPNHQNPSTCFFFGRGVSMQAGVPTLNRRTAWFSWIGPGAPAAYQKDCKWIHVNLLCQTLKWLAGVRVAPKLGDLHWLPHCHQHIPAPKLQVKIPLNAGAYSYQSNSP